MGYSTDRELSSYKDDQTVTRLQAELESERERNKQLEEDLSLATKNIWSVVDRRCAPQNPVKLYCVNRKVGYFK